MAKTNCVATRESRQGRASRPFLCLLAFLALFVAAPASAQTMSVKDYLALPTHQQSVYSGNFIAKMTADIGRTNPKLMHEIRDWFANTNQGTRRLTLELLVLQDLAKEGKIDLSKIPIEGVIVKVIEEKFPPPKHAKTARRK